MSRTMQKEMVGWTAQSHRCRSTARYIQTSHTNFDFKIDQTRVFHLVVRSKIDTIFTTFFEVPEDVRF